MNQKKISNKDNYISSSGLHGVDTVILCGGFGKRLRPVISEQPKVLAKIGGRTFLDILINNVSLHGAKNIILCVGYLKHHIKRHFDYCCSDYFDSHSRHYGRYNITFSEEESPLGTGGAIKNARPLIKSNPFMVMNGDSICNIDFNEFLGFHIKNEAMLSMALAKSITVQDYGRVILDKSQKIVSFNEKIRGNNEHMANTILNKKELTNKSLINAGIYIMQNEIFSYMPKRDSFSLENDLFPKVISEETVRSKCYGFLASDELLDIGTPERYKIAIDTLL